MTVKELIKKLQSYEENMKVVCRGENSGGYVDSASSVSTTEVTAFRGDDYEAVLISGSQVGMGSR